ncbi:MAG: type II toxin-antitoxin system RelE/ParE family toxin [Chlamydiia bacterium]|nr:type II toxin-antitoxin system RelE/ParE family toxin [Chlamydiia bacterium]
MPFSIELSRIAIKHLSKIPSLEKKRISLRLEEISKHPLPKDVKKIQGDDNLYRIRSGNYRILYRIYHRQVVVLIVDIDHCKNIYR